MTVTLSPAQLLQIAREERARRKAAWAAAGQSDADRARQDDALWSNIEQMAGIAANDATCMKRQPQYWNRAQRIIMARSIWATACKADAHLDTTIAANLDKVRGLSQLYRWVRPIGWSASVPGSD